MPLQLLGVVASGVEVASASFESIATVTVGSGGAANVEFTSIPTTGYKHLQVRIIARANRATYGADAIAMRFNSDTGSNYAFHCLKGDGSTVGVEASPSDSYIRIKDNVGTNNGPGAGNVGVTVLDILDYADTNKYTTTRALAGVDINGTVAGFGGVVSLNSGLWMNTSAITSIKFTVYTGINFEQNSHFALYGIRA